VDIRVALPDGRLVRERRKAPVVSKSGALRWGEARARVILFHDPAKAKRKEVPTLGQFYPRFLDGYARANRQKPSGVAAKETVCRVHLDPVLGPRRLDAIGTEEVQRLKTQLAGKTPKTVNNVLTVLNTLLRIAVEWSVIDRMPCRIQLLRVPKTQAGFLDFDEYSRLVEAAKAVDAETHLVVLLGGDAGLRCGEMMALEWPDVDFARRQLRIQRSEWKGKVTAPKGGRPRCIPMTKRLAEALRAHKHMRGPRVLCQEDGSPLTQKIVRNMGLRAGRKAGFAKQGIHVLRHTFCSHLAMRGAPARAIQELAGHQDLSTTQRYMHLSPAAIESAVRLLEEPSPASQRGDMLETGGGSIGK
jgi:integrase